MNAKESDGTTALMWAVRSNHPDVADLLIHHDAEINARTRKGEPPPRRAPDSGGGSHGLGIVRGGWPEYFKNPKSEQGVDIDDLIPDGSMVPGFYLSGQGSGSKIPAFRPKVQS